MPRIAHQVERALEIRKVCSPTTSPAARASEVQHQHCRHAAGMLDWLQIGAATSLAAPGWFFATGGLKIWPSTLTAGG
jgi:hypothetical protein